MVTLLIDHCVWRNTTNAVRQAGFRCATLKELGCAEARNGEILRLAVQRGSVLLTRDSDFTDLSRYPLGSHGGVIYLRITDKTMAAVHAMLLQALRATKPSHLHGALLTVEPTTYRLRQRYASR